MFWLELARFKHSKNMSLSLHPATLDQLMLCVHACTYIKFLSQQNCLTFLYLSQYCISKQSCVVFPNMKHDPHNPIAAEKPGEILVAFGITVEWWEAVKLTRAPSPSVHGSKSISAQVVPRQSLPCVMVTKGPGCGASWLSGQSDVQDC